MDRTKKEKNVVTIVDGKNYTLLENVKYQGKLYYEAVETDDKGLKFIRYTVFECIVDGKEKRLIEVQDKALQKKLRERDRSFSYDNFEYKLRADGKKYIITSVMYGFGVLIFLAFYLFAPSNILLLALICSIIIFICSIGSIFSNKKMIRQVLSEQEFEAKKH